jgi:ComF family protein
MKERNFSFPSFLREVFLELLAPSHCLVSGQYIDESMSQFSFISDSTLQELLPAPPSDEALNSMLQFFSNDAITVSSVHGLFNTTETADGLSPLPLIHALKYNGQKHIGKALGKLLGKKMYTEYGSTLIEEWECIIPLPLHLARKRQRGYNQAEEIADGLQEEFQKYIATIPVCSNVVQRHINNQTQTQTTSATERTENVANIFSVVQDTAQTPWNLQDKNVLLVDDVLTTGATMNACASVLLEAGVRRVDCAVLAVVGK